MKFILIIVSTALLCAPYAAFAQGGIVPCGNPPGAPCNLCHLYALAKNVIDFLLFDFILPVAVIALLIGGIFMLASRGNPQMLERGKSAIANTVIGVVIAFASWLIIATVVNTLGYNSQFTPAWNDAPICQASIAAQSSSPNTGQPPPPNTSGSCSPVPNGPCAVSNLSSTCWGSRASNASQICRGESGGNRLKKGDPITGNNGVTVFRSIGLFQINLSSHSINGPDCPGTTGPTCPGGGLNCPSAFEGKDKPLKQTPQAQALYDQCVAAAQNADTNITKACELQTKRGSWRDWCNVASGCGLYSGSCR